MLKPEKEYKNKRISRDEAVSMVNNGDKITAAMAGSEPQGLLEKLSERAQEFNDVTLVSCLMMKDYGLQEPDKKGHVFNESWFYGENDRENHQHGNVSYIPNNLHGAGKNKLANDQIDVFWGTAAPMDKRGYFSLSLGLTYEKLMIEQADLVVLEINENLPWTHGDTQVHISQLDYVVENTSPLIELPYIEPGATEKQIGENVAALIEDGSTLQLGIGGIPNAITECLTDKNDLGIHTEMFTDGMVDLFYEGAITNREKTLWPGKMVTTFALGTQKLYDFIDNNVAVEFQQGKVTNDPAVIGQNYKMVSVNTALQVDLTGQVCSEALGNKQYSGTGGQVDTHRGAQRSEGGKGIIALRSTAKGGNLSTIVAQLPKGSKVTLGRNDIDYIVTEHGVAHLKGKCIRDRVEAMISITHPDFRYELRQKAEEAQLW